MTQAVLVNYLEMWKNNPLCDTLAKLCDMGYNMRDIRKAWNQWLAE